MTTPVGEGIKPQVLNRLRRARGQLDAVIAALDDDADCRAVVTQLVAVSSAINRAGFVIVSHGMKNCLAGEDSDSTIEEMEKLFMMLS
jgi:DNA-binding FrmR family transcriptional regulator